MRKSCAIFPSVYLFCGDKKNGKPLRWEFPASKKKKGGGGLVITLRKRVLAGEGGGNNVLNKEGGKS